MLSFAGIANKYRAVVVWFQDAETLGGYLFDFVTEFRQRADIRQVAFYCTVGVFDDVHIGRVGDYEVEGVVF